jgi:hypothetical protein
MLSRRSFLLRNAATVGLASAAVLSDQTSVVADEKEKPPTPYIEILTFRLHFGRQSDHLLAWLEKRVLPLLEKHRGGPVGFFSVEVGTHVPAVVEILSYPSLAEMEASWERISTDADWPAALADLEKDGPGFFRADAVLLRATQFSPPLKATAPSDPAHKIYELRFYEASTERQLGYMHDRFAEGEIDVFHKCGIHPVLYADTVLGPNMPNMGYLIPFESEAHREQAWTAFRAHPDWKKVADEFLRRSGELARNISSTILAPASFSMLR